LHPTAHEVWKPFPVTLANKITLVRILLIPVFVGFGLYYAHSVAEGRPDERLRWAAIGVFTLAAISDALDGWVARHYNQKSKLGVLLDPLADKLLMLAAVCVLSFSPWPHGLPLYFVILSVSREILTIAGAFVIRFMAGKVEVAPHWTGKASTFTQFVAIGAAMLSLGQWVPWAAAVASVFVVGSGAVYLIDAIRQITASGHGNAES
jgi:CDP-diacylglycerol--glycerol-3-phosphate 3-phosphatidyltransferase